MRLLLCTPYIQHPDIVPGGINIWGDNLLKYRDQIESDVEVVPISFDRRSYVRVDSNILKRMYLGLKEYSGAVREAKNAMDSAHFDVIHICTSASISLTKDIVFLKAANKRGIKGVVHFHFGRIPQLAQSNNWEWKLIKRVLSLASTAITMDKTSFDVLCSKGYKNVAYCPNPLSMAIINQIEKEKSLIKRIPNKLLFVGHVIPSKGVYELVEACRRIDGVELHIVGKAEERVKSELINIAMTDGCADWLKFHGEISHEDVIREMLSASMFVFPSYTEGFPNVILEAMACETPIVASSVGAIPEMLDIVNGYNYGICVTPKDVDCLHDGINTFLDNPLFAQSVAKRSYLRVHELYAIPVVWEQLCNIWRKA